MNRTILALWKHQSKKGQQYLSGIIDLGVGGSANVVIFPNKNKKKDNYPDYYGKLSQPLVAPDGEEEKVEVEAF